MSKIASWWKDTARFLREVWIEVRPNNGRVSWPTFENVKLSTKVVIVSSIGLGAFIGLLDVIFGKILTMIVGGGSV
ncbi:MAG: SecE/Sec61-gamma subunit of protein translocation complex [Clostridiales bacterium]|jgi:preprotein translocase SecE subunit|nr:SecE/Sec61-gamma subunit of protein translocation complex [Clostridiales bacterium]MDN5282719.1 SecE/Sec61-gamma subunit of protein translocation complex [Candidatus Ozemobacter sp.]